MVKVDYHVTNSAQSIHQRKGIKRCALLNQPATECFLKHGTNQTTERPPYNIQLNSLSTFQLSQRNIPLLDCKGSDFMLVAIVCRPCLYHVQITNAVFLALETSDFTFALISDMILVTWMTFQIVILMCTGVCHSSKSDNSHTSFFCIGASV